MEEKIIKKPHQANRHKHMRLNSPFNIRKKSSEQSVRKSRFLRRSYNKKTNTNNDYMPAIDFDE
jgi:hypothetical protein